MMLKLSVLLCLLGAVAGYRICYGRDCYPTGPPHSGTPERPFPVLPFPCPTSYFLLTRKNLDHPEELCIRDHNVIGSSFFDGKLKTYVIAHGIWHNSQEAWVKRLCQAMLEADPVNCILMDWGSCAFDAYIRQVQAVPVLGADLAAMIRALQKKYGCRPQSFHLIGVNVGAHIAGCAGRLTKGLASITGLNPAAPMFEHNNLLHLTKHDACFVQVFHTDCRPFADLGFGMKKSVGHVDIYVNGGQYMPECPPLCRTMDEAVCITSPLYGPMSCADSAPTPAQCQELLKGEQFTLNDLKALDYNFCCSHYQAIGYYIFSIGSALLGRPCDSEEDCIQGKTKDCPSEGCPQLGHCAKAPDCDTVTVSKLYYANVTVTPLKP